MFRTVSEAFVTATAAAASKLSGDSARTSITLSIDMIGLLRSRSAGGGSPVAASFTLTERSYARIDLGKGFLGDPSGLSGPVATHERDPHLPEEDRHEARTPGKRQRGVSRRFQLEQAGEARQPDRGGDQREADRHGAPDIAVARHVVQDRAGSRVA